MGIKADARKHANNLDLDQFSVPANQQVMARETLRWVADHYPCSQAGVEDLAKRLGRSYATAKRYLDIVVKAGIVVREKNTGRGRKGGKWKTNTYTFQYLNRGSSVSHGPWLISEPQSSSSPNGEKEEKKREPAVLSSGRSGREKPPAAVSRKEGQMPGRRDDNPDDWAPAFGENHDDLPPPTVIHTDPAKWLAQHFEAEWKRDVLKKHRHYRGIRVIDKGAFIGWIRKEMLDHLSFDHVKAYIDTFIDVVVAGEIELKEGQSAWLLFTGWWGHQDGQVEDPTPKHDRMAHTHVVLEEYRRRKESGAAS